MCLLVLGVGYAAENSGTIEKGNFRLSYDDRGITGLANPHDPFGAEMLPRGQRLGLTVKFKTEGGDWRDVVTSYAESSADNARVIYTNGATNEPLKVTQIFKTDGTVVDWDIALEASTNSAIEVGDLAINIPVVGPRGEEPKEIFEHGFLKHQFISGNGSFLYFVRASGTPPFLIVTVKPGTKLEYFAGGFGRGGAQVFVHSGLSGANEKRGTWRQPHTSLKLGAAERKSVNYGFRFHWAKSYDEMREILFNEGLFDIRAVPGMTVPEDLTAKFSLHTKAKIESIEAEFPAETKITKLVEPLRDVKVYEVAFKRLGENMLTIHHDGGRKTYLEYFVTEPLETLIKKRASFIIDRQQIRDPSKWWDGVFGPYDMKNKVVRTIDDPDIFLGRMVYTLTCDDPGLCKAPYVAERTSASRTKRKSKAWNITCSISFGENCNAPTRRNPILMACMARRIGTWTAIRRGAKHGPWVAPGTQTALRPSFLRVEPRISSPSRRGRTQPVYVILTRNMFGARMIIRTSSCFISTCTRSRKNTRRCQSISTPQATSSALTKRRMRSSLIRMKFIRLITKLTNGASTTNSSS
jgi:hypothetical protein